MFSTCPCNSLIKFDPELLFLKACTVPVCIALVFPYVWCWYSHAHALAWWDMSCAWCLQGLVGLQPWINTE